MGQVYECGLFTLASNLSDDDQPWLPPEPLPWALKMWKGGPHKPWLFELLTNSPLASRGWCLQERHLSPRILHVYHKQVWVWECGSRMRGVNCSGLVYASDIVDHTLSWRKQNLSHTASLSRNQLLDCWDALVVDYTKRQLSNQSDRLAAISGIARRLQPFISCGYHAGIWESDSLGLLWYCGTVLETDRPPSNITCTIQIENRIENFRPSDTPTWSWAASDKPVRFWTHKVSGNEQGLQELQFGGVHRGRCTALGEISHHSTTMDEGMQICLSITLRAPVLPLNVKVPRFLSFDSILRPDLEYGKSLVRLERSSRTKAAQLHFVILAVQYSTHNDGSGIILARSKLYEGAFVRLGIWAGSLDASRNLDLKKEYIIV
jgi:hypothetical protein